MALVLALALGTGVTPRLLHAQSPPSAVNAAGRGALAGTVVDAAGQPLFAVEVTLVQAGTTTTTDSTGAFTFRDVRPGAYTVRVRRIGYRIGTFDAAVQA